MMICVLVAENEERPPTPTSCSFSFHFLEFFFIIIMLKYSTFFFLYFLFISFFYVGFNNNKKKHVRKYITMLFNFDFLNFIYFSLLILMLIGEAWIYNKIMNYSLFTTNCFYLLLFLNLIKNKKSKIKLSDDNN